ncbi:hypothetical protein HMPREF1210_01463 [Paenisporosarcina sp. HGH0030]|nr:hypothetical protein HMPREF1210_01463 [Paenisporosarcina sp. HGH0030]
MVLKVTACIPKGRSEEHLKQMLDNHREQTIKEEDNPV